MSLILQGEITEIAQQKLFKSRYCGGYYDLMEEALSRAEGMARIVSDAAGLALMPSVNQGVCAESIHHTMNALQQEISDAKIILDDFYLEFHKAKADDQPPLGFSPVDTEGK